MPAIKKITLPVVISVFEDDKESCPRNECAFYGYEFEPKCRLFRKTLKRGHGLKLNRCLECRSAEDANEKKAGEADMCQDQPRPKKSRRG